MLLLFPAHQHKLASWAGKGSWGWPIELNTRFHSDRIFSYMKYIRQCNETYEIELHKVLGIIFLVEVKTRLWEK